MAGKRSTPRWTAAHPTDWRRPTPARPTPSREISAATACWTKARRATTTTARPSTAARISARSSAPGPARAALRAFAWALRPAETGFRAGFETCDDGNSVVGDGCTATCTVEDGWYCPIAGRPCAPICGDGKVRGNETCDDLNDTGGDGCSAVCLIEPTTAQCGNGIVEGAEACDPPLGAFVSYTCLAGCRYAASCGDGQVDPGEECDLGVGNNVGGYGDRGCTPGCMRTHYCGDGIVDPAEQCDFGAGNGSNPWGCNSSCQVRSPSRARRSRWRCFRPWSDGAPRPWPATGGLTGRQQRGRRAHLGRFNAALTDEIRSCARRGLEPPLLSEPDPKTNGELKAIASFVS